MTDGTNLRPAREDFRWESVEVLTYKAEADAGFMAITRQVLLKDAGLACELRYFEMAAGGYSSLERHLHVHGVMILRGSGHVLIGDSVRKMGPRDLVTIPPNTWHQFRATEGEPFGFLCMVNCERDRPQLPTPAEITELRKTPAIAAFLDGRPLTP
ncbi:MAG: cupin domain-containing protein [Alphaproteobacteria bacterium]|nr:cupin domain-containing protein [Alphaproteobacteria bacterium]